MYQGSAVKRYFDTPVAWIAIYAFFMLVLGYLIIGEPSPRVAIALFLAFIMGARLGFGEAVRRFQNRVRAPRPSFPPSPPPVVLQRIRRTTDAS